MIGENYLVFSIFFSSRNNNGKPACARRHPIMILSCNMMDSTTRPNISNPIDAIPPLPVGWTRCHWFLTSKKRFCRQEPVSSKQGDGGSSSSAKDQHERRYCGHHRPHNVRNRTRIPCPYDPSHTIFHDDVEKHKDRCPFLKRRNDMESLFCYSCNVNSGGHGLLEHPTVTSTRTTTELSRGETGPGTLPWALQLAQRILTVYNQLFRDENEIPLMDLSSADHLEHLQTGTQHYKIRSGGSHHLHQQSSLIGHLNRLVSQSAMTQNSAKTQSDNPANNEQDAPSHDARPVVLLEVGAGRGITGLLAAGALHASRPHVATHLIMVDRSGSRGKADTILRRAATMPPLPHLNLNVDWTRVTCDLAHVDLKRLLDSKVVQSGSCHLVVIAKHLCGSGTDLALRSLVPVRNMVTECLLATCCHGLCSWDDYVGRSQLSQLMMGDHTTKFGREEFELLCRWSSGSVCSCSGHDAGTSDIRYDEMDEGHGSPQQLDVTPHPSRCDVFKIAFIVEQLQLPCGVVGLGRACQRLIDYGRKEYMHTEIFHDCAHPPAILHYVPPSVTPQNALLAASKG